jgi:hypothetical protein
VAESIYAQLQREGCQPRDIVSLSAQLLELVTASLATDGEQAAPAAR